MLLALAAIGGVVVLGLTQSTDVRGASETAVQEAVAHAEGVPETLADAVPEAGGVPSAQDLAEYLASLRADDYTTYTHPTLGYAFRYPKDFTLMTQLDPQEDIALLGHPRLPLGVRVTVEKDQQARTSTKRLPLQDRRQCLESHLVHQCRVLDSRSVVPQDRHHQHLPDSKRTQSRQLCAELHVLMGGE
jgi:hypothetical protein